MGGACAQAQGQRLEPHAGTRDTRARARTAPAAHACADMQARPGARTWLSTRSAAPLSARTKEIAPMRSAYRPRFCNEGTSACACTCVCEGGGGRVGGGGPLVRKDVASPHPRALLCATAHPALCSPPTSTHPSTTRTPAHLAVALGHRKLKSPPTHLAVALGHRKLKSPLEEVAWRKGVLVQRPRGKAPGEEEQQKGKASWGVRGAAQGSVSLLPAHPPTLPTHPSTHPPTPLTGTRHQRRGRGRARRRRPRCAPTAPWWGRCRWGCARSLGGEGRGGDAGSTNVCTTRSRSSACMRG